MGTLIETEPKPMSTADAQEKLTAAKAKVERLRSEHASAKAALKAALDAEDDGRDFDFPALKQALARAARELDAAETAVVQWQNVIAYTEKAERRKRFDEALAEARSAREEFQRLFRDACLALGKFYSAGRELNDLGTKLADRPGNGGLYYPPQIREAMVEVTFDPAPLVELRDSQNYRELQPWCDWRRTAQLVPLVPKTEPKGEN